MTSKSHLHLIENSASTPENLQIVVLDSYYDCWQDPLAQELFLKITGFKLLSYLKEYAYGALPIDTTDFIGTHLVLCRKENGKLEPIMGVKSTTLKRCKTHNVIFPILSLLGSQFPSERHRKVAMGIIEKYTDLGYNISYEGGWTIHPDVRKDKELGKVAKEISLACHVLHQDEISPCISFLAPVLKLKTDRIFLSWGFEPASDGEKELEAFPQPFLHGEPVNILYAKDYNEATRATAEKYRQLWDDRIVISKNADLQSKIKKAA